MIILRAKDATTHSLRVAAFSCIASKWLAEFGEVSLGVLLERIHKSSDGDTLLIGYADIFEGANLFDLQALYEPTLNILERHFGPLACIDLADTQRRGWGYSTPSGTPRRGDASPHSPAWYLELWRQRDRALKNRHPDQLHWERGRAPRTIWRVARRVARDKGANS